MITGTVNANQQARIQLIVTGPSGQQAAIDGLIDTGFNLFLTLSRAIVTALNLPFVVSTQATLADGSVSRLHCHRAVVHWDQQPRTILAICAEGGPLVGMSLLHGSRLTVDVKDGGAVTIEPLP